MIPINVTHTAIVTEALHSRLRGAAKPSEATTPLRHTLSTLISFFADSYKSTFGFDAGPPLHDALTIAYVSNPEIFMTTRYRVDTELSGTHTAGETVVDVWNYRKCDDTWGRHGKNCLVAESLQVRRSVLTSFRMFLEFLPSLPTWRLTFSRTVSPRLWASMNHTTQNFDRYQHSSSFFSKRSTTATRSPP